MTHENLSDVANAVDRGVRRSLGLAALALMLCAGGAAAKSVSATPETIATVLAAAGPGDTIRLAAGSYPVIDVKGRTWEPAITIIAGDSLVKQVALKNVTGFHWQGGKFDGGFVEGVGFGVRASRDISVKSGDYSGFLRNGVVIASSSEVDIIGNHFHNMGSDGIQIAESRRMIVADNRCEDFKPIEKAHPDCIQLWSRPTNPPTADIVIRNNYMKGSMQGIGLFNHVRNGVDDGGYDRITVIGNDVSIGDFYHGIALYGCRGCLVRDNKVVTLPNKNPKIRAWIRFDEASTVVACGNTVSSFPGAVGQGRCKGDVPMSVSQR
jgi:hypothetical protein